MNEEHNNINIHKNICCELIDIYYRKNQDYGNSFHISFQEEGMAMPRIRLTDKLLRFKNLTKSENQEVKDESIRDTLLDLANYAIMTIIELDLATGKHQEEIGVPYVGTRTPTENLGKEKFLLEIGNHIYSVPSSIKDYHCATKDESE